MCPHCPTSPLGPCKVVQVDAVHLVGLCRTWRTLSLRNPNLLPVLYVNLPNVCLKNIHYLYYTGQEIHQPFIQDRYYYISQVCYAKIHANPKQKLTQEVKEFEMLTKKYFPIV